jgi:hypothetical protein
MPVIACFDQGWGPEFGLKKFEKSILERFLRPLDDKKIILVNSTWYNRDYHETVMRFLSHNEFDRVFVISMLDFAVVHPDWFQTISQPVTGIGYYPGPGEIDFWALACQEFFDFPRHTSSNGIDTAFICLNRKPHWHRVRLFQKLQALDLVDHSVVTLGDESGSPVKSLQESTRGSDLAPNAGADQYGIVNDIFSLGDPLVWNRCFLNVVTETVWDIEQHYFVSEKIYKPIIGERPFLVYAPDGATLWLARNRFESYHKDFADITDLDLSHGDNIPEFLTELCRQGKEYYQKKIIDLQEKISYNKSRFDQYCREIQIKIDQGITCPI